VTLRAWSRRLFLEKAVAGVGTAAAFACSRPLGVAASQATGLIDTNELVSLDLQEAATLLRQKKVSPVELTRACLSRIEALNPVLNAFITVTAESALAQARVAEGELQRGTSRGPLHGIPVALKDLVDTAGVRTTAGSALFKDHVPPYDAAVVQRLRHAGAVLLGKLNMHEVAFGPNTKSTSFFGPVCNPWDIRRISGGSSGGSGAAVAAGLCFAAVGSDTGGSIRQPAAFCGVVGLMPSYGRVSTRGALPLSRSADHLGPMTRSVVDSALMLQAIAGYDPADVTSHDMPVPDFAGGLRRSRNARIRIGIARNYFNEGLDQEIKEAVDNAVSLFVKLGAEIHEVTVPISPARTVIQAEAFAYHAASIAKTPELYLPETLGKLRLGAAIDMDTYVTARLGLDQLRRNAPALFREVDVLLTPTTPVPPPETSALPTKFEDIIAKDGVLWRNARPFNLLAFPTISLPCGFTRSGLPVGLQLSGAPWQEAELLRIAHTYEQAAQWRTRRGRLAVVSG
jgi:aspartyl-tRNA(Asn)/glutamyl-tRNA(Gln) amidotransferase subunit A